MFCYHVSLAFECYSIKHFEILKVFKVFQKPEKSQKPKIDFFKRCPNTQILFIMISNPDFLLFFPGITGTV